MGNCVMLAPKPSSIPTLALNARPKNTGLQAPVATCNVTSEENITNGKSSGASEITDLRLAMKGLQIVCNCATEQPNDTKYLHDTDHDADDTDDQHADRNDRTESRGALYEKQDFTGFEKITYEKTDAIRGLIYDAIKPTVLFQNYAKQEVLGIVDIFEQLSFKKGECVIRQGEDGDDFFVVESGELSAHVTVKEDEGDHSEVKVWDYSAGSAFGELALIFGSPYAATIRATTDCKLWSLSRLACRSVVSQVRYEEYNQKKAAIEKYFVKDRPFTDVFDRRQIMDLTISARSHTYEKGCVILQQGQTCNAFYFVKNGVIETYRNEEKMATVVKANEVFGITSLLPGERSPLTYQAASSVIVYYLTKGDFEATVGSVTDVFGGNSVIRNIAENNIENFDQDVTLVLAAMNTPVKYEMANRYKYSHYSKEQVGAHQLTLFNPVENRSALKLGEGRTQDTG